MPNAWRKTKSTRLTIPFRIGFCLTPYSSDFFPGFFDKPLTYGDLLDFMTPLAVIPIVFFLYFRISRINSQRFLHSGFQRLSSRVLLGLGILLYVDGHGLHLSANSIARLIEKAKNPELFEAAYIFDEIISHAMLDAGIFLISLSLIASSYKFFYKLSSLKDFSFLSLGACFYGFSFAINNIE